MLRFFSVPSWKYCCVTLADKARKKKRKKELKKSINRKKKKNEIAVINFVWVQTFFLFPSSFLVLNVSRIWLFSLGVWFSLLCSCPTFHRKFRRLSLSNLLWITICISLFIVWYVQMTKTVESNIRRYIRNGLQIGWVS